MPIPHNRYVADREPVVHEFPATRPAPAEEEDRPRMIDPADLDMTRLGTWADRTDIVEKLQGLISALDTSMTWRDTPQGPDYWSNVHGNLCALREAVGIRQRERNRATETIRDPRLAPPMPFGIETTFVPPTVREIEQMARALEATGIPVAAARRAGRSTLTGTPVSLFRVEPTPAPEEPE